MSRTSLLAASLLLGCASPFVNGAVSDEPTSLKPYQVAERARIAFNELRIPVAEYNPAGIVYSGVFRVEGWWGSEAVADRVDCGADRSGKPLAEAGAVALEIRVVANSDGALPDRRTYVDILSAGTLHTADSSTDGAPCDLTPAFRGRLRLAILDDPRPPRLRRGLAGS